MKTPSTVPKSNRVFLCAERQPSIPPAHSKVLQALTILRTLSPSGSVLSALSYCLPHPYLPRTPLVGGRLGISLSIQGRLSNMQILSSYFPICIFESLAVIFNLGITDSINENTTATELGRQRLSIYTVLAVKKHEDLALAYKAGHAGPHCDLSAEGVELQDHPEEPRGLSQRPCLYK